MSASSIRIAAYLVTGLALAGGVWIMRGMILLNREYRELLKREAQMRRFNFTPISGTKERK